MGFGFEVNAWVEVYKEPRVYPDYEWKYMYSGGSFLKALWVMIKARKAGSGCVKLEWR